MSEQSYYHGNLPTAMSEKGIELINKDGMNALSLRKVASVCGVSHAAPYSHFASFLKKSTRGSRNFSSWLLLIKNVSGSKI